MPILLQVCLVAGTIALIAVAVALVRMLNRLAKTAEEVNATLPMVRKSIDQVEKITAEAHEVVSAFADIAPTLRRTANLVENIGTRAVGISNTLLDEVEGPVRGAVSLVRGIRAGANVLLHRRVKRHDGDGEPSPLNRGFDDE
jgi:hypothetical protein